MSYLRLLHKSWNVFWTFIGVLVLTLALLFGAVVGLMQLQPVKDQVATELQNHFNNRFEGVLSIGQISGFLPLNIELYDVKIYSDSATITPVLETSSIRANLDIWSLFRNQLVVKYLDIDAPNTFINTQSGFSLEKAFVPKAGSLPKNENNFSLNNGLGFQVIIPAFRVRDGNLVIRNAFENGNNFKVPDSLHFQNIQMEFFFEYTNNQRFVDIDQLQFLAPGLDLPEIELYGQIYNDDRFFELNAINLKVGNSSVRFSGQANDVNILDGDVVQQFTESNLTLFMERFSIQPDYITRFMPEVPLFSSSLQGSWNGEGTLDSLSINDAELYTGESIANLNGHLKNLKNLSALSYGVNIVSLVLGENELEVLSEQKWNTQQIEAISTSLLEGEITGDLNNTNVNFQMSGSRGDIALSGGIDWDDNNAFNISFTTDSLDLGDIIDPRIKQTDLSLRGEIKSSSLNFRESEGGLVIQSDDGMIGDRTYNQLSVLTNWKDGFYEPDVRLSINGSVLTTNGWVDVKSDIPEFSLAGKAEQLHVNDLIRDERLKQVTADVEYSIQIKGINPDKMYGQVSLDILNAIAGTDTLDRHQLYFDFNEPVSKNRLLRFTSTAFDATIEGDYHPSDLYKLSGQWKQYFSDRFRDEILLDSVISIPKDVNVIRNQNLTVTARLKNTNLISSYFPAFPKVQTEARLNSTINVNSNRLLFNFTFVDAKTEVYDFISDSLVIQVTGGFRQDSKLKEFSGLQIQATANQMEYRNLRGQDVDFSADLEQDSLFITNSIAHLGDNATHTFKSTGILGDDALTLNINNFYLGGDTYRWQNRGVPTMQYRSDQKIVFQNFLFDSEEQFIEVNGTFSSSPQDSVNYNLGEVDLQKISQIIGGRISFGGILNGEFTTQTLTTVPTIMGDINVEAFRLNNMLAGDININSRYNSKEDRFDTNISVSTDSSKYPEYYASNDNRGQFFDINGYVLAPIDGNFPDVDSLYRFKADFKNIDLWILPIIGPKVFAEGSGLAYGDGVIWGNLDTYDFEVDFIVGTEDAAYIRPLFLDTYYYAQGEIRFTRHNGFIFKDVYLIDPSGGNAILSGYYDLNNFANNDSMYISLDMDEFQFLNSSFDPTAAFFGKTYGSGTVIISGTNLAPVLRTEIPITISDFSEISIPLLEETQLNEDNRFIRFVDSFEGDETQNGEFSQSQRTRISQTSGIENEELSFAERFTLDLQFVANNLMTVRLIFDPVTGDMVTAEGTGRIRILLEDEQVSMFGRFDIEGGRYQFVSGDIFTRRFDIESGGSITWEGDPANARMNLNAIYSARPDINTLRNTGSRDPDNIQRVPVDLVLNIGGTISSIENDFFFRLPDNFESQQNSTLSTQLAAINRDEELKLIQAANFMLMGDFIPVSSTGDTQNSFFGDNLSGSAAVLNPLISSQVINPLLSNQVNSLLNSDLSSLDVDFNLNTYNQVDLGVALRLYNDKLILRREGQITGRQSNIGDLGATYRINRTFAVTAFHRQDLSFGTISSTEQSQQSQDINGVGVEAKLSFNTWNEFFNRLFSPFRKLFGSGNGNKEQNQDELTENRQGEDPA
ncbi:MAG: hypothetical protein WD022_00705 [Balneolaceae bacterium]